MYLLLRYSCLLLLIGKCLLLGLVHSQSDLFSYIHTTWDSQNEYVISCIAVCQKKPNPNQLGAFYHPESYITK